MGLVASSPPKLLARAGDGSNPPGLGTARLETDAIPLDGKVHAVVVDIRVAGPGRIRVFLEGTLIGQGVSADDQLQSRHFSGGSNPAYGEGDPRQMGRPTARGLGIPNRYDPTSKATMVDNWWMREGMHIFVLMWKTFLHSLPML